MILGLEKQRKGLRSNQNKAGEIPLYFVIKIFEKNNIYGIIIRNNIAVKI